MLAARRLGYAITGADLHQAWMLEQPPQPERRRPDTTHAPAFLREAS
jgi:hypothetical protein